MPKVIRNALFQSQTYDDEQTNMDSKKKTRGRISVTMETDGDNPPPEASSSSGSKGGKGAKKRNTKSLHLNINPETSVRSREKSRVNPSRLKEMVDTVTEFGYSEDAVSKAVDTLQESGMDITYDSLIQTAHKIDRDQIRASLLGGNLSHDVLADNLSHDVPDDKLSHDSPEESLVPSDHTVDTCSRSVDVEEQAALRERLDQGKLNMLSAIENLTFRCKMCNDAEANILLLPCAHLVCCENCLMDVRRCPVIKCNKVVRGTKEVFWA